MDVFCKILVICTLTKFRLLQALLPLAIVENKPAYKAVKQQAEDWDDVQVCSISEILVAVEVIFKFSHKLYYELEIRLRLSNIRLCVFLIFQAQKCKIVCSIESINTDWGWFFLDMVQMDATAVLLGLVEMILEELQKMKNH